MSHQQDNGKDNDKDRENGQDGNGYGDNDPAINSFRHYIDSFNAHDMDAIMGHLDPACTVETHLHDGTVMVTPSRNEMKQYYERDSRENRTVVVPSVKRIRGDESIPAGQVALRTMIHMSTGKYAEITYYMREDDLMMVKHVIHTHGDL